MTVQILKKQAIELTGRTYRSDIEPVDYFRPQIGPVHKVKYLSSRAATSMLNIVQVLCAGVARVRRMGSSNINEQLYTRNDCRSMPHIRKDL